jgi:hypothetical protein
MKKILYFLFLLPLLSCSDILDKEPYDMYEKDVILTTEGMDLLLRGAYSIMAGQNYYGALLYLYEAAKGPDFFVRNVSGGFSFYTENRYAETSTTNGNARTLWLNIYHVIRNTTILIENIDSVIGNTEELRRIKGEAYTLRGLAYFDLMRLFAYPPIFSVPGHARYDDQFRWGVPIINTVEKGSSIFKYEVRRETADSTYKFIIDQFERAERLLEGRTVVKGQANAATAKALLIRAYLYLENWDKVIKEGEAWIEKYGSRYTMIPWEGYPANYHKSFNMESVWEFGYSTSDNLRSNSLNYWVRRPTWNEPGEERDGTVSQNVGYSKLGLTWGGTTRGYDFLVNYANDIRQYLICHMGLENKPEYLTVRKYVGDPYHFVHNIPVVRLPEIYLSIAEAYANKGDMGEATAYTSLVSQPRRKAAANITTTTNVLNERRRELILEGHTYWDHFRTARNITGRHIIESINSASVTFGSPSANYRVVYPIPLSEMNANPAIRDQQNPGYPAWVHAIEED